MKIACIGWGSLIWNPKNLLIHRFWYHDGPILPVEFARQSNDGRFTLVIEEQAMPVRTLWALMATNDLTTAVESLRIREGISEGNAKKFIASVSKTEQVTDPHKAVIKGWVESMNVDVAIWTNLPPKFNDVNNRVPTVEEALDYLNNLDINKRENAKNYVRRTPIQIDTVYRRHFERELGWDFLQ